MSQRWSPHGDAPVVGVTPWQSCPRDDALYGGSTAMPGKPRGNHELPLATLGRCASLASSAGAAACLALTPARECSGRSPTMLQLASTPATAEASRGQRDLRVRRVWRKRAAQGALQRGSGAVQPGAASALREFPSRPTEPCRGCPEITEHCERAPRACAV